MSIPVVMTTCDQYEWTWGGWWHYWSKHVPAALSPIYFVTESKTPACHKHVNVIHVGECRSWTDRVRRAMPFVEHERFMVTLEDFWPRCIAQAVPWIECLELAEKADLPILGIQPNSHYYTREPAFGQIGGLPVVPLAKDSQYISSLHPAIWKREVFLGLLHPGSEDPWNFEIKGTQRARGLGIQRTMVEVDWFAHCVKRGKFIECGVTLDNAWKREASRANP